MCITWNYSSWSPRSQLPSSFCIRHSRRINNMLQKQWGRTPHRAGKFQTLPSALVQTCFHPFANLSTFFRFPICRVMTFPKGMWCSSDQYQLWHLRKRDQKTGQKVLTLLRFYIIISSVFSPFASGVAVQTAQESRLKQLVFQSYLEVKNNQPRELQARKASEERKGKVPTFITSRQTQSGKQMRNSSSFLVSS